MKGVKASQYILSFDLKYLKLEANRYQVDVEDHSYFQSRNFGRGPAQSGNSLRRRIRKQWWESIIVLPSRVTI